MQKQRGLGGALTTILISCTLAAMAMVAAAIVTKELLYLVAGALFLISGVCGVFVIRNLSRKIGGGL